eukprot:comp7342_c0_seq1/m.3043 comp7342_c0_seq1/g.3043  ORF comp7342_c0_seq1/g.3043 comp7342_c0_seq1/m.3043 type:complete len:477 (-) comp7342_c0_seq1:25-1455(-)
MEWVSIFALVATFICVYVTYIIQKAKSASVLAKKLYGPSATLINGNDYVWRMDSLNNLCHINAFYNVEGTCTADEMRQLFQEKVINNPNYSRFRERVVSVNGLPFWVDDAEFDIKRHIVDLTDGPKNEEELMKHMGELSSRPFPVDRPLWKMEVIHNYNGENKTVITNRMHHVIGDGIGMVTMMFNLLEKATPNQNGKIDDSAAKVMRKKAPNPFLKWLMVILQGPMILLRVLGLPGDHNPWHSHELGGKRYAALSPEYAIEDVKAIKNHYGVTVNDALMGMLGAAINRYFAMQGHETTKEIRLFMPVNMRTSSKEARLENKFSPAVVTLPIFTPDPETSIFAAKKVFTAMKKSVGPLVFYLVGVLCGGMFMPKWLGDVLLVYTATKGTAVVTNVPGPQELMKLAGHTMTNTMFWVPARGPIGVGISLLSYGGRMQVGIVSDEMSMKEPKILTKCFDEVFRETREKVEKAAKAKAA